LVKREEIEIKRGWEVEMQRCRESKGAQKMKTLAMSYQHHIKKEHTVERIRKILVIKNLSCKFELPYHSLPEPPPATWVKGCSCHWHTA
jgi:hypothetical protein